MASANFPAAKQLAGRQGCQGCKEKKIKCILERGKLRKGLLILLLVFFLDWAMFVFVTMLLLLSCNRTIFALVLHNVPKVQTSNLCWKVYIRSPFLVIFSCPWLVWPNPPTNLPAFGQYIIKLGLISIFTASCIYITLVRPVCTLSYQYLFQTCWLCL